MAATESMSEIKQNPDGDTLTRFLLADAQARGAIIRGTHIIEEANRIHGLNGPVATLFGQTLLASILLLSISKGGMRQVLQLDSTVQAPIKRLMAESSPGAVRGYVDWQEEETVLRFEQGDSLGSWMGSPVRLATIRDLGVGHPYISTIENESDFLADHLLHYLNQSVQIRADVILLGDIAIMIEAMPGCDEEHWFKAVESMAKIPDSVLESESPESILSYFETLRCKVVGIDTYTYNCPCSAERMAAAIGSFPPEQLHDLADANGNITVSCQYCDKHYAIRPETT